MPRRAEFSEASEGRGRAPAFNALPTPHLCAHRNLRKGSSGLADEINFEDFLTIMSYFRPIDTTMDEEQVQLCRKEKLRCACGAGAAPLQQAGGRAWARGGGVASPRLQPPGRPLCVSPPELRCGGLRVDTLGNGTGCG